MLESLVKKFNQTTVEDRYGAMNSIEEIREAFRLDINIQEKTQWFKIEDKIITFDFEFKTNSTWIFIDLYDEDDYVEEEEYIEEDIDFDYCEDDE